MRIGRTKCQPVDRSRVAQLSLLCAPRHRRAATIPEHAMRRLHLLTLTAGFIAACGNGVPPDDNPGGGGTGGTGSCATNADCVLGDICVTGSCQPLVTPGEDAGATDQDSGDMMPVDAGDMPPVDAGEPVDAGHPDAGHPDAGPPDAGHPDAGPPDAGHPDAGPPDAGSCTTTWANTWDSWFSTTCFSCHEHTGENKSFADSSSALSRMQSCSMPQGGPCVTPAELTAIEAWETCGSP